MSTGNLPDPTAPGPLPGEPGHFAHHDWLEGAINALNQRLVKRWYAKTVTVTAGSVSYVAMKYDTVNFDTGLDAEADQQGGGIVMGAGAPVGLYRYDAYIAWAGNNTGARRMSLEVNGVAVNGETVNVMAVTSTGQGNTGYGMDGIVYLPAGATFKVIGYQASGGNLATLTGATRLTLEYLGFTDPPLETPAGEEDPEVQPA